MKNIASIKFENLPGDLAFEKLSVPWGSKFSFGFDLQKVLHFCKR